MANVSLFRGIRYRNDLPLDELVAPPYDVMPAAQAAELRARSSYNAAHIDLPVLPGETARESAYAEAAATFSSWRDDGVLLRDEKSCLYLVDQTYTGPDGRVRTRRGFIARVELAGFDERVVLPHERTHSGPKLDRLRLYRAAHADLSQIFLLFPDDDGAVGSALKAASGSPAAAPREATDGDGNRHRLVPLAGLAAEGVATALRDRPLYIADGHHRYETALAYRDERRADGDHSADTLMVYLCSISDPGLTVFPTHRLVRGVAVPGSEELRRRLETSLELIGEPLTGSKACRRALDEVSAHTGEDRVFGLYLTESATCLILKAREPAATERLLASGFSPETAGLSVTALHELVFHEALGMDAGDAERHTDYAKSVPDALEALAGGEYALGAFLPATRVSQVRAVADHGETMPQKSTYFYPKLLTGLVYDALGD